MKTITYHTAEGKLTIVDNPMGTKAWSFQPISRPKIKHLELVELSIKTKEGTITGGAYFDKSQNIFRGRGILELNIL